MFELSSRDRRLIALSDWLTQVGAVKLWGTQQIGRHDGPHRIQGWSVNGVVILIEFLGDGWLVHVPAARSPIVADVLNAVAAFCGVAGPQGDPS